jgi:hypothetical protein
MSSYSISHPVPLAIAAFYLRVMKKIVSIMFFQLAEAAYGLRALSNALKKVILE